MANGLNNPAMVVGANAIKAVLGKMHLHSGDPGGSGTSNLTTASAQTPSWGSTTGSGSWGLSASVAFTGVAANGACQWISLWDGTETTWYGNFQLSGDQTANAAGEYTVTACDFTGSAT